MNLAQCGHERARGDRMRRIEWSSFLFPFFAIPDERSLTLLHTRVCQVRKDPREEAKEHIPSDLEPTGLALLLR